MEHFSGKMGSGEATSKGRRLLAIAEMAFKNLKLFADSGTTNANVNNLASVNNIDANNVNFNASDYQFSTNTDKYNKPTSNPALIKKFKSIESGSELDECIGHVLK